MSPCPRRERAEDRIEPLDHRLLAADHQAVAAFEPPHAAAGADIEVVDAARAQRGGARDVVLPERVAAVDDGVARRPAGRPSSSTAFAVASPAGTISQTTRGGFQPLDQVLQRGGGSRALPAERQARLEIGVEHDAFVPVAHQAPGDIRAHPAQTDDTDLHPRPPFRHTYQHGPAR